MKSKLLRTSAALLGLMASTWAPQAQAFTQCTVKLFGIWAGDGGSIWLNYTIGGSAAIAPNDPNKTSVLAMAMTAFVGGRTMTVRYSADNADCIVVGRTDFVEA